VLIDIVLVGIVVAASAGPSVQLTKVDGTTTVHYRWGAIVVQLLVWTIYTGLFNGVTGQTLGKRAMRIKVVRRVDGAPIGAAFGLLRAVVHALLGQLCAIPGIVDNLWPLWDVQKQALHDKVAGSIVVSTR
jgi:uncharacterized RDD family membrane protein YckC